MGKQRTMCLQSGCTETPEPNCDYCRGHEGGFTAPYTGRTEMERARRTTERRQTIDVRSWREGEFFCAVAVTPYTPPDYKEDEVHRSRHSRHRAVSYALGAYAKALESYKLDETTVTV